MFSRSNGIARIEGDEDDAVSLSRPVATDPPPAVPLDGGDWYMSTGNLPNPPPMEPHHHNQSHQGLQLNAADVSGGDGFIFHQTASSSQLEPSQPLLPFKPHSLSSFLNVFSTSNNLFDPSFNFSSDPGFVGSGQSSEPGPGFEMPGFGLTGFEGFEGLANPGAMSFNSRPKMLRPLEMVGPTGPGQPTLFQKRVMLRQESGGSDSGGVWGKRRREEEDEDGGEEEDFDVSMVKYDECDELNEGGSHKFGKFEENVDYCEGNFSNSNANSIVTGGGDQKGKRKGLPAKNLMAERRRRKKLNDRLYLLRSVVPKISKMDRASILGDAIDYLKELLQRISDLHNELESSNSGSLMPTTNFLPSTPTPSTLGCRVKEELCPNSLPMPKNQPAKIEVRAREGRAVNIHMFCSRRPGILLSTIRALDSLGLDIQQAVISCFNGFALDIFRAEQCSEGHEILPEQIKAVLLDSAGFHGVM